MQHIKTFAFKAITAAIACVTLGMLIACLAGCKITRERCNELYPAPQPDTTHSSRVTTTETINDTTLTTQGGTALMDFYVYCDSTQQVLLDKLGYSESVIAHLNYELGKTSVDTHKVYKTPGVHLQVGCRCDSQQIYFVWKTTHTDSTNFTTVVKNYPVPVPANNTKWEKFKIATGGYTFGLSLAVLIAVVGWGALKLFGPHKLI